MSDSKLLYEQLQEEREKQGLKKKVLMTEREPELDAREEDSERLENADAPTKGAALQEAEKLVERITQEHARLAAARAHPHQTLAPAVVQADVARLVPGDAAGLDGLLRRLGELLQNTEILEPVERVRVVHAAVALDGSS